MSIGTVSETNGVWGYSVYINGKRYRKKGFKTKRNAQKALDARLAGKPGTSVFTSRTPAFWTSERLIYMRDHILPNSRTMPEAFRKAKDKWSRRSINHAHFSTAFKSHFGHQPKQYLGVNIGPIENPFPNLPPNLNPAILIQRTKDLEKEVKRLSEQVASQTHQRNLIEELVCGVKTLDFNPPTWVLDPSHGPTFHGIPTIAIGDIHLGEKIDGRRVLSGMDYNVAIAKRRLERTFRKTCVLMSDRVMSRAEYPGIVLALGGDLFSGNIHSELRENAELPLVLCVAELLDPIVAGIKLLLSEFKKVFVTCTIGNHSRLDKKPRYKNAAFENIEWLFYFMLQREFRGNPNVKVVVPDSLEYRYKIYGVRYLQTHGEEFKGGTGITGPLLPWTRGTQKKQQQAASMAQWLGKPLDIDIVLMYHWHQYFHGTTFIVNGPIVEMGEYAIRNGYPYAPSCSALWITNPKLGITVKMPVYAEPINMTKTDNGSWVSVFEE